MRFQRTLYKLGSWAFVVVGAGHLLTSLLSPRSPAQERIIATMREFVIAMPGSRGNLYQYHQGFSLMMGMLLMGYGSLALLILAEKRGAMCGTAILRLHVLVAALAAIMSWQFFFAVPVTFTVTALVSYGLVLALAERATDEAARSPS